MIKVYISGNRADVTEREPLTSGTVGKVINFAFTEDWRPLIKYAVFEGSGCRIALTNIGDSCIIPHEVLAKHGGALRVGVYGRTADGSAATPTVYAQLGIIQRGADPNADPSTKPTLPVWAQIQAQIGDLSNLTTEDKTSLVAAINEAALSGGGSGGKDGTGIESITYKGEDESGGNMYTVLLTDGTSYEITAPKGAKGDKGEDAAADLTLGLTGATVGQIAKIAAVDASGVPTAWSPVDMPSGGEGETWEKLYDGTIQIEQETMAIEVDMPRNDSAKGFQIYLHFTKNTAQAWDAAKVITVKVNGASVGYYTFVDKLVSDFYAFANREFDSIGKLEYTIYSASLYFNRTPMYIQLQTGSSAEQKNDGKISISFVSPYAGAIELLVYGRY